MILSALTVSYAEGVTVTMAAPQMTTVAIFINDHASIGQSPRELF
jgi:hypothetical protein